MCGGVGDKELVKKLGDKKYIATIYMYICDDTYIHSENNNYNRVYMARDRIETRHFI